MTYQNHTGENEPNQEKHPAGKPGEKKSVTSDEDCNIVDSENTDDRSPVYRTIANVMKEKYSFCWVEGIPYTRFPNGNYYPGFKHYHNAVLHDFPNTNKSQREESLNTLRGELDDSPWAHHRYIAFSDYIWDTIEHKRLRKLKTSRGVVPFTIPHPFPKKTEPVPIVDQWLDSLANNRPDIRTMIEELIARCIWRNRKEYGCITWLYGEGENGKSTLKNVVAHLVGGENISYIDPFQAAGRFMLSDMAGKAVNWSDDTPSDVFYKSNSPRNELYKKLATADRITTERKGKDPFQIRSFAAQIISSNNKPRQGDISHGMTRRMVYIPLTARFDNVQNKRIPDIEEQLTTPEATAYLLSIALNAVDRMINNGQLSIDEDSKHLANEARQQGNNVASFLKAVGRDSIIEEPYCKLQYHRYKQWCKDERISESLVIGQARFSERMSDLLHVPIGQKRIPASEYTEEYNLAGLSKKNPVQYFNFTEVKLLERA